MIRLTVPHYYDFGSERGAVGRAMSPAAWDALRESSGAFGLPASRAEWEAAAARQYLVARAEGIAVVAERLRARTVCSYAVGSALVELNLARIAPALALTCTDYAPRTVSTLRELFHEATVVKHDLRHDAALHADLHLFHRVDVELSDREWREVFAGFDRPVLVVASELLNVRSIAREIYTKVRSPRATRAGYIRTEGAFRSLWRSSHMDSTLAVGDLTAFLLMPR